MIEFNIISLIFLEGYGYNDNNKNVTCLNYIEADHYTHSDLSAAKHLSTF